MLLTWWKTTKAGTSSPKTNLYKTKKPPPSVTPCPNPTWHCLLTRRIPAGHPAQAANKGAGFPPAQALSRRYLTLTPWITFTTERNRQKGTKKEARRRRYRRAAHKAPRVRAEPLRPAAPGPTRPAAPPFPPRPLPTAAIRLPHSQGRGRA